MRVIIGLLAGLCTACAGPASVPHTGNPPGPVANTVTVAVESGPATVVDRNLALSESCRVVRALDGRAICAAGQSGALADASGDHEMPPTAAETAAPDALYLVIGSFAELENARRWAAFNDVFGTDIRAARFERNDRTMHRVVVGPIARDNAPLMHEILSAAGAGRSWQLSTCSTPQAGEPADGGCTVLVTRALAANTAE